MNLAINSAVAALKAGKVIAYPTEAVFGLGVDPFNEQAVLRLLRLKKRSVDKGLILIASQFTHIQPLVKPLSDRQQAELQATWPGPHTWLCPASDCVPGWVTGSSPLVALRITAHPPAVKLCDAFGGPIVSTSANPTGLPPAQDWQTVVSYFGKRIDVIIKESVGRLGKPTIITDLLTGKVVRG